MEKRIKELRKALGLTQSEFAEKVGLTRSSLQKLESGINGPSNSTLVAMCHTFGVSRSWLENGTGEMFVSEKAELTGRFADEYAKGGAFKIFVDVFLGLTDAQKDVINEIMDEYVRARAAALQSGSAEPELLDVSIQTAAFLEKLHESGQEEA